MPWVRAILRGQKIYARADESGELSSVKGRVEIRYKPNDGRRYEARADNLERVPGEVLPDETCGPAEAVTKEKAAQAGGSSGAAGASSGKPAPASAGGSAAHATAAAPAGATIAYADGACSGNPGPAGLGVVLLDGPRRIEISEYLGEGTNNIAELTAVLRAIEAVPDPAKPLVIRTDSQYTIGVLQKGWKAKANKELIFKLREALRQRPARIEYVPGHAGVLLNERADALAREAVERRKSRREELVTKKVDVAG